MAVVVRSRRLVNPSVRRSIKGIKKSLKGLSPKSRLIKGKSVSHWFRKGLKATKAKNPTTKKRKLSPKQIAFFGTPRQKAALRASRARKRNAGTYSIRKTKKRFGTKVSAGFGQRISTTLGRDLRRLTKKAKPRKKNIGEIVSISLAGLNPGKKRNTGMAKRRKARNAGTAYGRSWSNYSPTPARKRRKNSGTARRRTMTHRKRRMNPVYRVKRVARRRNAGTPRMLSGVLGKAIGIIGGAVATRYATQFILGGSNNGIMGYLGNAVSAFALGWGTGKLAGREMGTNVMIGGFVSTILRVITDQTSLGKYINLSLQGAGKGGDIGMGIIQDSSFSMPQVNMPGSMTTFVTPRSTRNYVASQMDAVRAAVAPKPGMGNVFGGQQRRRVM